MKIKTLDDVVKVNGKFFVLETGLAKGEFEEKNKARPVIIPGCGEVDAFAILKKVFSNKYYEITEAKTGGLIFSATDKPYKLEEALNVVSERIKRNGIEAFNERLVNAINNNGLSPRYKIEITEDTKALVAQETHKANVELLQQQDLEYKKLRELNNKLFELSALIVNQSLPLIGLKDWINDSIDKIDKEIDKRAKTAANIVKELKNKVG